MSESSTAMTDKEALKLLEDDGCQVWKAGDGRWCVKYAVWEIDSPVSLQSMVEFLGLSNDG